jgi:hypothetical protein
MTGQVGGGTLGHVFDLETYRAATVPHWVFLRGGTQTTPRPFWVLGMTLRIEGIVDARCVPRYKV